MNGESNQDQQKPVNPTPTTSPTPGNQTGPSDETKDFFSRHSKTITRLIIIAIIIIGAAIYSQSQNPETDKLVDEEEVTDTLAEEENETDLTSENDSKDDTSVIVKDSTTKSSEVSVTKETSKTSVKVSGKEIIVTAQSGNGYTHLARKALAEYLDTTGDQGLKAEHKIFIEDYLQKKISDRNGLHTGDEVSFSQDQIQEAIDVAQDLTDAQVQNLSQYVPLVPSLN
ncbi:MAG: hypothetical protein A2826_00505 [Candidatus Doudnabacteria bacterium RIFCSPHIGHO2_01_FULL_43_23]|uniref:Uncharacterized protein n=1 Tax=Candidatus Doudnabacteria bacterium RIFCSPHIGHO2_01_FULL_43_23 TaxID=1817822 RepID=A0A1F5NV40_9BACT|nr:MAG: hypothetical protein A2826_00505 [Candidatus Doudnabacteria bacterium RIFCSPHIGHO2_01_FULL_43_23]